MTNSVEQLIEETIKTYYEYAGKIEAGCLVIANAFQQNDIATGSKGILNLSEGLGWMIDTEEALINYSYSINSPVRTVVPLFEKINVALETQNYPLLSELIQIELLPIFKDANQWKFELKEN